MQGCPEDPRNIGSQAVIRRLSSIVDPSLGFCMPLPKSSSGFLRRRLKHWSCWLSQVLKCHLRVSASASRASMAKDMSSGQRLPGFKPRQGSLRIQAGSCNSSVTLQTLCLPTDHTADRIAPYYCVLARLNDTSVRDRSREMSKA